MSVDTVSNMLSKIKNAVMRKRANVEIMHSKINEAVCRVLKTEEFIEDYKIFKLGDKNYKLINVFLKYADDMPSILNIQRVSTPGKRVYTGYKSIKPLVGGTGIYIVSTSRGVLSHKEAKKRKLGGEVICGVW